MSKLIAACVDDLLFLSKIQTTARGLHVEVRPVTGTPDEITARIAQWRPSSVVIDLNSKKTDAIGVIRSLKSCVPTSGIPVTGFLSHVDVATRESAEAAGCDRVWPRSVFVQKLSELLSVA
jgi:CheY-like chemotaxis protein